MWRNEIHKYCNYEKILVWRNEIHITLELDIDLHVPHPRMQFHVYDYYTACMANFKSDQK